MADVVSNSQDDSSTKPNYGRIVQQVEGSVQIPRCSFTAYRLLHATSTDVSHLATTVFLGKVPDVWIMLADQLSFFSTKISHKISPKSWVTRTAFSIRNYIAEDADPGITGSECLLGHLSSSDDSHLRLIAREDSVAHEDRCLMKTDHSLAADSLSIQRQSSKSAQLSEKNDEKTLGTVPNKQNIKQPISIDRFHEFSVENDSPEDAVSQASSGEAIFVRNKEDAFNGQNLDSSKEDHELTPGGLPKLGSLPLLTEKNMSDLQSHTLEYIQGAVSRGLLSLSEGFLAKNSLQTEYVIAEKKHKRAVRKMRVLVHKSKEKAQGTVPSLKLKIFDKMIQDQRAGDIIRVDKMLVMIKKASHASSAAHGNEACVQDHWKEYFVVLRATSNVARPLKVQLFGNDRKQNFEGKPEYSVQLNSRTRVGLFSNCDKTLSIADIISRDPRVFLMCPKYLTVAYKWLYVVKEVLGEQFFSMVNISLADEATKVHVNIPQQLLHKSIIGSDLLLLQILPFGYKVDDDALLAYVNSKVDLKAKVSNEDYSPDSQEALASQMGFCFKFYDRVEWAPHLGKSLLFQSQILREDAILEHRKISRVPLIIENPEKRKVVRPHEVEGFLSRITDTSGKEFSKLRAFYKVQYFFSSGPVLFFTSFFRGLPPSPHNMLLKNITERVAICKLLPQIYTRNPFETDEKGHIPWIHGAEFDNYDTEALEEFSRKIQQIVNAKAMVDLSMVSTVRLISFQDIHPRHLYLQLCIWYSSSTVLKDMDILDSGFEIRFVNGTFLRLLAPLKIIRDEWVERLNNLASFWKLQTALMTKSLFGNKLGNIAQLKLDDYVDSNVSFGTSSLETKNSFANFHAFTNSALAMSTSVLCSGYLHYKEKKHSSFSRCFAVLCPGYLLIFSAYKRSKLTGSKTRTPIYERYMSVPLFTCYIYSGRSTQLDLLGPHKSNTPGECDLARLYPDGWRSSEEEFMRCFSLWFGGKRALRKGTTETNVDSPLASSAPKNPGLLRMTRRLGVTGKTLVFLARSRQEREHWVHNLLQEINRYSRE